MSSPEKHSCPGCLEYKKELENITSWCRGCQHIACGFIEPPRNVKPCGGTHWSCPCCVYIAKIKGHKMEFKEKSSPYYSGSSSEEEKD